MRIALELNIAAPCERVFEFLESEEQLKLWMPELVELRFTDVRGRNNPLGKSFIRRIREGMRTVRYRGELIGYKRPGHLSVRFGNRHVRVWTEYHLHPEGTDGNSTHLVYRSEITAKSWWARVTRPFNHARTVETIGRRLHRLKMVAEQSAAPQPTFRQEPARPA